MNNYLKLSFAKIWIYFLIFFIISFTISFISNIFWNQINIINEDFKAAWNNAYIKTDKEKLWELLKTPWIQWEVNKTEWNCKEKWFYKEWNFEYFCNDNTIIAFKQEEVSKSIQRTTQISNIIFITIFSLFASIIAILITPKTQFLTKIRKQVSQDELDSVYEKRWIAIKEHLTSENIGDLFNNYIEISKLAIMEDERRYKSMVINHITILNKLAKDNNLYSQYKKYFNKLNQISNPIRIHYWFILMLLFLTMYFINTNTAWFNINWEFFNKFIESLNTKLSNIFIVDTSNTNAIVSAIIWKVIIIYTTIILFKTK